MAQLMLADVMRNLTAYELAFLLLSAYLHDVGMTPEQNRVTSHYQFLMTGNPSRLSHLKLTNSRHSWTITSAGWSHQFRTIFDTRGSDTRKHNRRLLLQGQAQRLERRMDYEVPVTRKAGIFLGMGE